MEYTDQEIIELMKQNREQGAVALLEKYTGLVWSVCAKRLEDPEDIRECVNMAFAEFCMGFDRFCTMTNPDGEAPSLRGYLCTIAIRKAVNQYRSNFRRTKAEEAARQREKTLQEIQDQERMQKELEDALECLEPLDSQIIRMKYYGGLSYQEIAGQLNMNYETVKKRGQRSLKKLWKILLIGLIFLFLIACAVALYRGLQFMEGVGINWRGEEHPVYRLSYVSPACTADDITFSVEDAIYQDGMLYLAFGIHFQASEDDIEKRWQLDELCEFYLKGLAINGEPAKSDGLYILGRGIYGHVTEMNCRWQSEDEEDSFSLEISLADLSETSPAPIFTLELSRVSEQEDISTLGTVLMFEDTGFLVTPGIQEGERTKFSLYVLNGGLGDGAYRFSPLLVDNYKGIDGREPENVKLTGEDGTVYESLSINGRTIVEMDRLTLQFPQVEPGEYQMSIPYLCLDGKQESESVFLRLPTENGESLSCDETILFPNGTGMHLTAITAERYGEGERAQVGSSSYSADGVWWYRLKFEPVLKGDLRFCVATTQNVFFRDDLSLEERESAIEATEESLMERFALIREGGTALGGGEICLYVLSEDPPAWVRLTLVEPVYLLERSFELKVLVK